MTTFYLDHVGGSDGADGLSFANRWKTFATGATEARTAPGDVIRVMASPEPTSLGMTATWTQDSKTVTLNSALTANISNCDSAWTGSANVTATATTTRKEGSNAASLVIADAFTTGKVAYFATGTLDLSGYRQVSFWMRLSALLAASTLSIRLCSDTTGDTTVDTIAIPDCGNLFSSNWMCVTVDTGAALGSSIQSVALYADLDPGTLTIFLDNIIACKDSTAADSLTLNSLVGKINNLNWVASTAHATDAIRKPTAPNRNGFRYKVTAGGGGNSGGTEPTWPQEIGLTVTDGALTWTCEGLEDTWYGIQSINGATVLLDNGVTNLATAGRGYSGATETVTTYKREAVALTGVNSVPFNAIQEPGTAAAYMLYTGGWNSTDMSTQTGETWLDMRNGLGHVYKTKSFVQVENLNSVRGQVGIEAQDASVIITNCHGNNHLSYGIDTQATASSGRGVGAVCNNNTSLNYRFGGSRSGWTFNRMRLDSSLSSGAGDDTAGSFTDIRPFNDWHCANNAVSGVAHLGASPIKLYNLVTRGNFTSGVYSLWSNCVLVNPLMTDSTPLSAIAQGTNFYYFGQRWAQTANNHLLTTDGGTIISATDQRHTASGISWKFRPTHESRSADHPMRLSVGKIAVGAGTAVSVNIWTRRDSTNIKGQLLIVGGQLPGVNADVSVACEPTINTWELSSTLNFTPSEAGTVEITFLVWDGVGTTNNFWIDDLGVSQA